MGAVVGIDVMGAAATESTLTANLSVSTSVDWKEVALNDDLTVSAKVVESVAFAFFATLVRTVNATYHVKSDSRRAWADGGVVETEKLLIELAVTCMVDAMKTLRASPCWSRDVVLVSVSVTETVTFSAPVGAIVGACVWVGACVGLNV